MNCEVKQKENSQLYLSSLSYLLISCNMSADSALYEANLPEKYRTTTINNKIVEDNWQEGNIM